MKIYSDVIQNNKASTGAWTWIFLVSITTEASCVASEVCIVVVVIGIGARVVLIEGSCRVVAVVFTAETIVEKSIGAGCFVDSIFVVKDCVARAGDLVAFATLSSMNFLLKRCRSKNSSMIFSNSSSELLAWLVDTTKTIIPSNTRFFIFSNTSVLQAVVCNLISSFSI